jgi:phosphoglycerate dehydrogenase-like enzyme
MNIVFPDFINLTADAQVKLQKLFDIKIYKDTPKTPEEIIKRIKDAQIVTANFIDLTGEIIKNAPKLKYIISPAAGYDWIDIKTAKKLGIRVLNCPTYNSQSVAEHAIGLIFAVKRHLIQAHDSILRGQFDTKTFVGTEVLGKYLVTVGHGNIGKRVLKMAEGLGMKTSYIDTKTTKNEFDSLIRLADIIVLSIPLKDSTRNIFDVRRISLMKKNAILINVARGLVVDQEALYQALSNNKIAGAGIDTFPKDETITKADANITRFAKLNNTVTTPHVGFNTLEASQRLGDQLIEDIESCTKGKPINIVS